MCNIIVYLAVDKEGTEWVHESIPVRKSEYWVSNYSDVVRLPKGTIKKLAGKDLTWEDGFIKYTSDDYDPILE